MSTSTAELVKWALAQVNKPYIFAASGQICTPEFRRRQVKSKPDYAANIIKYCPVLSGKQGTCAGCKYNGMQSWDCSGLTMVFLKKMGFKYIPHGASSQYKGAYWAEKGLIKNIPERTLGLVFHESPTASPMGHVGIYLANGFVVDARGHASGVVKNALRSYPWTHYTVAKYTEGVIKMLMILGEKSQSVKEMQQRLLDLGYKLPKFGADGDFGAETLKALNAFQLDHALPLLDSVDEATFLKIMSAVVPPPVVDPVKDTAVEVLRKIRDLTDGYFT